MNERFIIAKSLGTISGVWNYHTFSVPGVHITVTEYGELLESNSSIIGRITKSNKIKLAEGLPNIREIELLLKSFLKHPKITEVGTATDTDIDPSVTAIYVIAPDANRAVYAIHSKCYKFSG